MKEAHLPPNESERLKALEQYQILDTLPEQVYDDITKIASEICGTPTALLTLIDEKRQWFKSKHGFEGSETPREHSFCAHAIINPLETMIVEDARYDERFHDNPLTKGDSPVIFYAGVPIVNKEGHALGSLCVIDSRPREITDQKLVALQSLAKLVNAYFELRKTQLALENSQETIKMFQEAAHEIDQQTLSLLQNNPKDEQVEKLTAIQRITNSLK